jgi:Rieske Fe-S protein
MNAALTRRHLGAWLGRAALALGLGGGLLGLVRFARRPRVDDLARRVAVGPAVALPVGSQLHLAAHDIHVLHDAGGLYALGGRCSHLGCSVRLEPEGFSCPCHGARFDLEGMPRSGPAPRPLRRFRVSIDERGEAWVHLDESASPGARTRG